MSKITAVMVMAFLYTSTGCITGEEDVGTTDELGQAVSDDDVVTGDVVVTDDDGVAARAALTHHQLDLGPRSVAAGEDCGDKWLRCAGTSLGMLGACAAAAASYGALTLACAGLGLTFAGTCGTALAECSPSTTTNPSQQITTKSLVGQAPDSGTTAVCSTNSSVSRVTKIEVRSALGIFGTGRIMNAIKLTCSSGQVLSFDAGASGTSASWQTRDCGAGKMVQGFVFDEGGTAIDGVSTICDVAGTSSGTDSTPTKVLGSGTDVTDTRKCDEGSYVYGIRFWKNTGTKKYVQGVETLCRKQW
jgi:hypothetical protein